jgi:heme exporter protein C
MWWKILLLVGMSLIIILAYAWPPPQAKLGDVSRIFYFHVPVAWVTVVAFLVAMINSVRYLRTKKLEHDLRAAVASRLGLLFAFLATVTGSIFAKAAWGSFWNWDPRETSLFILLLIYGAYLALRSAVPEQTKRAALSAVYSILAFATVPFLVFVVPRVFKSLHPTDSIVDKSLKIQMSGQVSSLFFPSLIAFTVVFFWIYHLEQKAEKLIKQKEV